MSFHYLEHQFSPRDAGYRRMTGYVLPDNDAMLKLAARLDFKRSRDEEDPTLVKVVRALD